MFKSIKAIIVFAVLCFQLAAVNLVFAADSQKEQETKLITAACMDYVEGFYESNGDRIAKGVHPDLVKRFINNGKISEMSREALIKAAVSQKWQMAKITVDVYDINGNIALAKVTSDYVDYVQLAKFDGQWQVVNVLWGMPAK